MTALLSIKLALKYAQLRDVESMRAIALAHQGRNLADFEKALRDYKTGMHSSFCCLPILSQLPPELSSDPTIRSHLTALYDTLLEQNLLRIIEPYSVVELEHVAEIVGQGRQAVEAKYVALHDAIQLADSKCTRLSQMILDKVFYGVLDQGRGCLLVYDQSEVDVSVFI